MEKKGTYLNVRIKTPIYERLEDFRKKTGQTKTAIVEIALTMYMDNAEEQQRLLNKLKK